MNERVRFLETVTVRDATARVYEQGKEYELSPDSARRWLVRGKAVSVQPGANAAEPVASPVEDTAQDAAKTEQKEKINSGKRAAKA